MWRHECEYACWLILGHVSVFPLRSSRSKGFPLFSCPDKNKVNFIPRGSAFCPVKLLCSSLCSSSSPVAPSSYAELGFHGNTPATTPTIRIKDTDAAGAGATDGSTDTTDTTSTDPGSEGISNALVSSS